VQSELDEARSKPQKADAVSEDERAKEAHAALQNANLAKDVDIADLREQLDNLQKAQSDHEALQLANADTIAGLKSEMQVLKLERDRLQSEHKVFVSDLNKQLEIQRADLRAASAAKEQMIKELCNSVLADLKTQVEENHVRPEVQKINCEYAKKKTHKEGPGRDGFVATFGDQTDFFAGLEAYSGRPMVSDDEELFDKMQDEFVLCSDPRVKYITTTNYGGLETDLVTEWEFAVAPKPGIVHQ